MRSVGMKKRFAIAGLGMGVVAFLGACASHSAPAPTTTIPSSGTNTTTTNVLYHCIGTGNSASAVISDQTTGVAITLPTTATVGAPFTVGVNVGNLNLSAAPSFLDLNSAGLIATIGVTGANANATVAANNFLGNGASIDLNLANTTATAASPGAKTVTVGTITLVVGTTGFVCTPVGTPASASVTAA
jgi:hypothetical protein